jgi:hypothetical protein
MHITASVLHTKLEEPVTMSWTKQFRLKFDALIFRCTVEAHEKALLESDKIRMSPEETTCSPHDYSMSITALAYSTCHRPAKI